MSNKKFTEDKRLIFLIFGKNQKQPKSPTIGKCLNYKIFLRQNIVHEYKQCFKYYY